MSHIVSILGTTASPLFILSVICSLLSIAWRWATSDHTPGQNWLTSHPPSPSVQKVQGQERADWMKRRPSHHRIVNNKSQRFRRKRVKQMTGIVLSIASPPDSRTLSSICVDGLLWIQPSEAWDSAIPQSRFGFHGGGKQPGHTGRTSISTSPPWGPFVVLMAIFNVNQPAAGSRSGPNFPSPVGKPPPGICEVACGHGGGRDVFYGQR